MSEYSEWLQESFVPLRIEMQTKDRKFLIYYTFIDGQKQ